MLPANLDHHADALAAAGLPVVADAEEAAHATHELLRTHRDADLRRRDVEGRWARICDRVWAHRGVSLLSTPDLGVADKDQLRLALDPLIGIEVHLVVSLDTFSSQLYGAWLAELRAGRTTSWQKYAARVLDHATGGERSHRQAEAFWAGHELASLLARWGWTFHADRLHVVVDPTRPSSGRPSSTSPAPRRSCGRRCPRTSRRTPIPRAWPSCAPSTASSRPRWPARPPTCSPPPCAPGRPPTPSGR